MRFVAEMSVRDQMLWCKKVEGVFSWARYRRLPPRTTFSQVSTQVSCRGPADRGGITLPGAVLKLVKGEGFATSSSTICGEFSSRAEPLSRGKHFGALRGRQAPWSGSRAR